MIERFSLRDHFIIIATATGEKNFGGKETDEKYMFDKVYDTAWNKEILKWRQGKSFGISVSVRCAFYFIISFKG